jgi:hypothetical protein
MNIVVLFSMAGIIQGENPASLQNMEGFVLFPVPVDGYACYILDDVAWRLSNDCRSLRVYSEPATRVGKPSKR